MGNRNFNFGRGVIAEGRDQIQIRRNFASVGVLIDRLETVIPFFEESIPANSLLVQDGTTARKFTDSGVKIDPATQEVTGLGGITVNGVLTINGTLAGTGFLDEDAMGSDAADKVASQQSIKAYVDTEVGSHTHVEADITDLQAYMLDLVDDTTPKLSGDLALAVTGVNLRSFEFDRTGTAVLTIRNVGDGVTGLVVDGSIWTQTDLIVSGTSQLDGNVTVGGTVDGKDVSTLIANVVEDTTPQAGGDFNLNGFDLTFGDNNVNFEFNRASTGALTITNLGAGVATLEVVGPFQSTTITVTGSSTLQGNVTIGDGTAVDRTLTFNASANDGEIKFDQDPGLFLFDHGLTITSGDLNIASGDIIVSGTVDGVDIAARDHDNEGTALLSTGEGGGSKFLREDGDGTCSWQAAAGGGGDLVDDTTPQAGGDIDMNAFDIQFDDATGIRDDSDNEQLIFQKTSAAVTYFEMTNAAAGQSPTLSVAGETNVDFNLLAKGTGILNLGGAGNVGLFASVAYVFGPNQNKKAHLGSESLKWDTAHFGGLVDANETGVRGAYYAAALSNPPTGAQLDSGVGAPASLGSGFTVMVKDTTSGNYWFIGTDGTEWRRTAALTVLS